MKLLILSLFFLLFTGCGLTSSRLPDEFWAYGTWRYDTDETVQTVAAKGVALITMHFTREQDEQYLIDGTVTYDADTLSCDTNPVVSGKICSSNSCELSETIPGELSGVAVVRDGKLLITQHWVTKPDEKYTWYCRVPYGTTQSSWAVWQTMGPIGAGMVDETWEVDISEAAFIDDLPVDEVTDEKAISANFDIDANYVVSKGLIGFYRQLP